jgi:glyoxylase-like metal-dependent hydrolase (beta-lactamase superfamily II)
MGKSRNWERLNPNLAVKFEFVSSDDYIFVLASQSRFMEEISDGIFVETGYEGVNVGAILSKKGVICIDTPSYPRDARDWAMKVERLQSRPIRYIILTDCNGDRILNTRWLNAPIITHRYSAEKLAGFEKRYPQNMLESLSKRNPKQGRELSYGPVERASISFSHRMEIFTEYHHILLNHLPGPSAGSLVVEVVNQRVIFTGDILVQGTYPALAELDLDNWILSLNHLLDLTREDNFMLIPGRGIVTSNDTARAMLAYLDRLRVAVRRHIAEGLPRVALKNQVGPLLDDFPSEEFLQDWAFCQIQMALERIYDELTLANPPNGKRSAMSSTRE